MPRGPVRHFIRRVQPELDEAGPVVRLVGTCQDVTDVREAEARARRSDVMLDSVFQAIPDLFFWHAAMLDRETPVLALKREVNGRLAQLGRPPRYTSVTHEEDGPDHG